MKKILSILLVVATLMSCSSQEKETVQKLNVAAFKAQIEKSDLQLIDVRTPEEYEKGHIEAAKLIDFFASDFKEQVAKLDKDKSVYLYCKSGGRSGKASKILANLGFKNIYDLKGGYTAWEAEKQ